MTVSVERQPASVDETDERVLEYLFEKRSDLPPAVVAWNLSRRGATVSPEAVGRRLRRLERAGLVEGVDEGRGYYRIDEIGVAYLAGTLDESALRDGA